MELVRQELEPTRTSYRSKTLHQVHQTRLYNSDTSGRSQRYRLDGVVSPK